jgi:hypothetical protein
MMRPLIYRGYPRSKLEIRSTEIIPVRVRRKNLLLHLFLRPFLLFHPNLVDVKGLHVFCGSRLKIINKFEWEELNLSRTIIVEERIN